MVGTATRPALRCRYLAPASDHERLEWSENWVSSSLGVPKHNVRIPYASEWNVTAGDVGQGPLTKLGTTMGDSRWKHWIAYPLQAGDLQAVHEVHSGPSEPTQAFWTERAPKFEECILVCPATAGQKRVDFVCVAPSDEWVMVEFKQRFLTEAQRRITATNRFPLSFSDFPDNWDPRGVPPAPSLDARLQGLRHAGDAAIADRIDFLRAEEEADDDIPLSESAALGFLDFLDRVDRRGTEPSLTTTRGWLCSTWRFGEGGAVLVIWFKNRLNTMLTTLPRDSGIPRDIDQDPRSQNPATLIGLLNEHHLLSWRAKE